MSGNDQLRAFFERWQRLEEDKKAVSDDLKEMFAEMKGHGFDTKAARKVFRDSTKDRSEVEEDQAIYDLYWNALHAPSARPAHARVENIEEISPGPQSHAAPGAEPSIPSSDDAGAKSGGTTNPPVGRGGDKPVHFSSQSEQGTPDLTIPAFLQRSDGYARREA